MLSGVWLGGAFEHCPKRDEADSGARAVPGSQRTQKASRAGKCFNVSAGAWLLRARDGSRSAGSVRMHPLAGRYGPGNFILG